MQLMLKKDKVVGKVVLIETDQIRNNPAQPRTAFEQTEMDLLASSISENGLLQPITVRRTMDGTYELISGERRLRACKMLGETKIASIVIEKTEQESAILAIIENLHRQDLNMFEQARALKNLMYEWNVTQEEAAIKLGMAQSTLANKIRILKLTPQEQDLILGNHLTERHARALLKLNKVEKRIEAISYISKSELNVSQSEKLIAGMMEVQHKRTYIPIIKDIRLFVNTINKAISVMKSAGIPALAEKTEEDGYIEYVIKIPKKPNMKNESS